MKKYIFLFLKHIQTTKNLSHKSLAAYQSDLLQFIKYKTDHFNPNICEYISYLNEIRHLKGTSIRRKNYHFEKFLFIFGQSKYN